MAGRRTAAQDVIEGEVLVDNAEEFGGVEEVDAPPYAQKTEQELKRESYTAAESALKARYMDEFKALVREEAEKRDVVYTFRKTEEEKAREQYEALIAQFPHLAQQG